MNHVDDLCPNCGLCCDSTLFADVELRKSDDPKRLTKLGLEIWQKTRTKLAFPQPCACFDGKWCKIYGDRPTRCRLFECGLLKKVSRGDMTTRAALKRITEAKAQAAHVRDLLRACGQHDEQMPLTHRYTEAASAPVDLSDKTAAKRQGELMRAMHDLMQLLQRDFLS